MHQRIPVFSRSLRHLTPTQTLKQVYSNTLMKSIDWRHAPGGKKTVVHNHNYVWYEFYREKKVRLFLCGDYEFLCNIFGLTGATGKN